jgi:hypothetical protein
MKSSPSVNLGHLSANALGFKWLRIRAQKSSVINDALLVCVLHRCPKFTAIYLFTSFFSLCSKIAPIYEVLVQISNKL